MSYYLTLLFFIFELIDIRLNNKSDLKELCLSYIERYKKSPILFFMTNLNFLLLSFCIFYLQIYSFLTIFIYTLYISDIVLKLWLFQRYQKGDELLSIFKSQKITLSHRIALSFSMSILFFISIS